MAIYTGKDGRWSLIQITEAGQAKMAEVAPEHHPEWRHLGVAILHRLVVENLLGLKKYEKPKYVHTVKEVADSIKGEGLADDDGKQLSNQFPLARSCCRQRLKTSKALLPQRTDAPKSTYFYPKWLQVSSSTDSNEESAEERQRKSKRRMKPLALFRFRNERMGRANGVSPATGALGQGATADSGFPFQMTVSDNI